MIIDDSQNCNALNRINDLKHQLKCTYSFYGLCQHPVFIFHCIRNYKLAKNRIKTYPLTKYSMNKQRQTQTQHSSFHGFAWTTNKDAIANRLICSLSNTRLLLSTVHIVKESCCVIDGLKQKAMAAIEHAMRSQMCERVS